MRFVPVRSGLDWDEEEDEEEEEERRLSRELSEDIAERERPLEEDRLLRRLLSITGRVRRDRQCGLG